MKDLGAEPHFLHPQHNPEVREEETIHYDVGNLSKSRIDLLIEISLLAFQQSSFEFTPNLKVLGTEQLKPSFEYEFFEQTDKQNKKVRRKYDDDDELVQTHGYLGDDS